LSWLGREDSNLRMAESKSTNFLRDINGHSEILARFARCDIKSLKHVCC
jgi:hypothetical protein